MGKQTRIGVAGDLDKTAASDPVPHRLSPKHLPSRTNHQTDDELIVSLSDAYENRRARQVVEWEQVTSRQFFAVA